MESSFLNRLRASLDPRCKVPETPDSPSVSLVTGSATSLAGVESLRRRPSGMRQLLAKLASAPPAVAPSPKPPGLVTVGGALVDIVLLRLRFSRTFDRPSDAEADGEGVMSRGIKAALAVGGEEEDEASDTAGSAINCGGTGEPCKMFSSARAVVAMAFVGEAVAAPAGMFAATMESLDECTECADSVLRRGDCD